MEGKRIGIVVGGAGAIPEAAIRMAQEHDVELVRVEDIKQEEYEPTRIPEQVYTIHPRPEIPDITKGSLATATSKRLKTLAVIISTLRSSPVWSFLSLCLR